MELYKKYRPKDLKNIHGNKSTVESLNKLVIKGDLPHAILLTGPHGCGKTTIGRIIKNKLKCSDSAYKELDAGVYRGIDTVRDIRKQMKNIPINSKYKVFLIDECHMLGRGGDSAKNEAQNAFLKALEDTPSHVFFILCTTNPEMLTKTIVSRCSHFKVEKLKAKEMINLLLKISKKEKFKIKKPVLKVIAESSQGHVRDAIQLLDKVATLNPKQMLKAAKEGNIDDSKDVKELCHALVNPNVTWDSTRKILNKLKTKDAETVRRQIIGYANVMMLNGTDASDILGWFLYKTTYDSGFALVTQFSHNIVNEVEPPC